ncbi:MAG: hypothetical protein NVS2B8_17700 [Vulcanimicrobiaceae bacterium]
MATSVSGDFEAALRRLEEIVQKLERENVGLDESVALFKEGKTLAQKCERLLADAQTSIDAAARGDVARAIDAARPVPNGDDSRASGMPRAGALATSSLFDAPQPDEDPDL